jgi:hypothetical protein
VPDWNAEIRQRLQNLQLTPAREAAIVERRDRSGSGEPDTGGIERVQIIGTRNYSVISYK